MQDEELKESIDTLSDLGGEYNYQGLTKSQKTGVAIALILGVVLIAALIFSTLFKAGDSGKPTGVVIITEPPATTELPRGSKPDDAVSQPQIDGDTAIESPPITSMPGFTGNTATENTLLPNQPEIHGDTVTTQTVTTTTTTTTQTTSPPIFPGNTAG